jgi:hypothetical protein
MSFRPIHRQVADKVSPGSDKLMTSGGHCLMMVACATEYASVKVMIDRGHRPAYEPLTVARLGVLMADADESRRWRLVAEFLEDYRHEPPEARPALLSDAPGPTGDEHWDVFLAALAEHVAARDGRLAPAWTEERTLRQFWFPFNTRSARTDAIVHAPAAFRRRGVYISPQELEVA